MLHRQIIIIITTIITIKRKITIFVEHLPVANCAIVSGADTKLD